MKKFIHKLLKICLNCADKTLTKNILENFQAGKVYAET